MFTVLGLAVATFCGVALLIRSMQKQEGTEITILWVLSLMYAVGKILGFLVIGPRFIRWYMADVGYMGLTVLPLTLGLIKFGWSKAIAYARIAALVLFYLAAAAEIFTFLIQSKEIPKTIMARGDLIDLVIYVVGYAFVLHLLYRLEAKQLRPVVERVVVVKKRKQKRLFRP